MLASDELLATLLELIALLDIISEDEAVISEDAVWVEDTSLDEVEELLELNSLDCSTLLLLVVLSSSDELLQPTLSSVNASTLPPI